MSSWFTLFKGGVVAKWRLRNFFILMHDQQSTFWWFKNYFVWNKFNIFNFGKFKHDLWEKHEMKFHYILYPTKVHGENVFDLRAGVRIPVDQSDRTTRIDIWSGTRDNTSQKTTLLLVFLTQSLKQNQWGPLRFELQPWGQKHFYHWLRLD